MSYRAIVITNGKESRVLPRSRKRTTFDSIEDARLALERKSARLRVNSRGLIADSITGEIVLTLAL